MASEPRSPTTGAVVGTFVVGDGTLVGQQPIPAFGKSSLILRGKPFVTAMYEDFEQVFPVKASLVLRGKSVSVNASSTPVAGKGRLILQGKPFVLLIPTFVHMEKARLVLRGKAFTTPISVTEDFLGTPTLILKGKPFNVGEVTLVPNVPINIILTPSVPQTADLVASVPQTYDLVPTVEEFR